MYVCKGACACLCGWGGWVHVCVRGLRVRLGVCVWGGGVPRRTSPCVSRVKPTLLSAKDAAPYCLKSPHLEDRETLKPAIKKSDLYLKKTR